MLQARKLITPLAGSISCTTTVRSVALYSSTAENVKGGLDAANRKVGKVLADGLGVAGMYSCPVRSCLYHFLANHACVESASNTLKEAVVGKDNMRKDDAPAPKKRATKETAETIRRQTEAPNC